jgi:tetratricopeptide (TPR) repeat protein
VLSVLQAQSDTTRFFSRKSEARDVSSLWQADRVTVLHGPTAVGKSSLLNKFVLPLLRQQTGIDLLPIGGLRYDNIRVLTDVAPDRDHSLALLGHWIQFDGIPGHEMSIADFLLARPQLLSANGDPHSVLVAIDQFEELFTTFPTNQTKQEEFINELAEALQRLPALKLLLVVRDEHVASLSTYETRLSQYPLNYVQLDALTPTTAVGASQELFVGTGHIFDSGVAEELVDQIRTIMYTDLLGDSTTLIQDQVMPFLIQVVCAELLKSLPPDLEVITSEDLHYMGGVDQALARFYDTAMHDVQLEMGETEQNLRTWIESTFITELGTRGSANRGVIMTADLPNRIADTFAKRHILVLDHRLHSSWYELVHDRMIAPIRQANSAWRADRSLHDELKRSPGASDAFFAAAEEALADGDLSSARRFAHAALVSYQESGDMRRLAYALILKGTIARAEGNLSEAEEDFRAALSRFVTLDDRHSTVRTLSALADIRFLASDYLAAAEFQREAVAQLPTAVDALIGLGYALWYGGSPADAEATFSQALARNAMAVRALAGRGQVRSEMREYAVALADLDQALTYDLDLADVIDTRSARAVALVGLGRFDEAERELAAARAQDSSRARTLLRAARIAEMKGQVQVAIIEIERALISDSPLPSSDEANARRLLAKLRSTNI